ncbi:MAG: LysR family transcriptional regulator [Firmicutes bacterium]|nr:LysR family transcriptional regulator [Bacillota bacterium]
MNFLSLEYFLIVAEELNITKAAERLYISQQSLSSSIIKLERSLGVRLFNRTPVLSLTYAGTRLAAAAKEIMGIKNRVLTELDDINKNKRGELKIGISHTRGYNLLPVILPEYKKTHPLVDISLTEANNEELENRLQHGMIDLMFGFLPIMLESVVAVELLKERLFLVVPKAFTDQIFSEKSDFMRGKFSVAADVVVFKDYPMLMLKAGNRIRGIMDSYFTAKSITPNIVLETENIETAFALSVKGMGITVYPEMFLQNLCAGAEDSVDLFPLADSSATLAIGYSSKRYLSSAAKDFIDLSAQKLAGKRIEIREIRERRSGTRQNSAPPRFCDDF